VALFDELLPVAALEGVCDAKGFEIADMGYSSI
jgi:hypothetical protein